MTVCTATSWMSGKPLLRKIRFTSTRMRARALSRCDQSTVARPPQGVHQLGGDHLQAVIPHDVHRTFVVRKRVVKGDLVGVRPSTSPRACSARICLANSISVCNTSTVLTALV